jgi:cytoskeletal protein CcmA (bactofilin family)
MNMRREAIGLWIVGSVSWIAFWLWDYANKCALVNIGITWCSTAGEGSIGGADYFRVAYVGVAPPMLVLVIGVLCWWKINTGNDQDLAAVPITSADFAAMPIRGAESATVPIASADSATVPIASADSATVPITSAAIFARPKRTEFSKAGPSIITSDVVVNGTINCAGDIQIDGCLYGDVHSAGLVIGDTGQVHGEIFAENVTIRGNCTGRIRARKVQLSSASHVEGDILHKIIAIEFGAFFEGNCRHSDKPLAKDPDFTPENARALEAEFVP